MTDAQLRRLPPLLREIVQHDRDRSLADHFAGSAIVHWSWGHVAQERARTRRRLSAGASGGWGRAPTDDQGGPPAIAAAA